MSVTVCPPMFLQFLSPNNSGSPANGFKLFTYQAGTSTKQATYTDSTQGPQNANPIILDANGVAVIWGDPTLSFKFVWAPANDTDPPTSPLRILDNFQFPLTLATLSPIATNYTPLGSKSGTWLGKSQTASGYGVSMSNSAAAADAHIWEMTVGSTGTLTLTTTNDNGTISRALLQATRSGAALVAVTFGNGTDNPTYTFAGTGALVVGGTLGINGATGPAQLTGWGSPTGNSVQNNFSGAGATLGQTSAAVAQIIATLKAMGVYGA